MKLNRSGFPSLFELKGHFIALFVPVYIKKESFSQGGGSAKDPFEFNSSEGEGSEETFPKRALFFFFKGQHLKQSPRVLQSLSSCL